MATLGIKGHPTRGGEVIQLLEMLGGENKYNLEGTVDSYCYYIDDSNKICSCSSAYVENVIVFTLEEFEEKFPYKVGDKVIVWIDGCRSICNIQNMEWDSIANEIKYKIQDYWYSTINLQPYKEETMEERKYADLRLDVDQDDKLATEVTIDGNKITPPKNYLIGKITKVDNGMLIEFVKKQPQYPKDYVECASLLNTFYASYIEGYKNDLLVQFQKLLICRDAYWKIAGEEMGLDKPWEPDYDSGVNKYGIISMNGVVQKSNPTTNWERHLNKVLEFPTEEMRDAFFENFKDLIEECKELL